MILVLWKGKFMSIDEMRADSDYQRQQEADRVASRDYVKKVVEASQEKEVEDESE